MSHRGNLTERLVLIPFLLAKRPRSQKELAEYFDVDTKTIKRDIDALSRTQPISDERRGREVFYIYTDGYRYQQPAVTPAELAALLLAQEAIAPTGLAALSSPFGRYGQSLLAKVRVSLPEFLREKLDALALILGSAAVPAKDFESHAGTIERLTNAAVARRRVLMQYYTLKRDSTKERKVDPYSVYFDPDGATIKLIGFDHFRQRIIPFAIDHIKRLSETDERFTRPEDYELRKYLAENCFNGIHNDPITVRLRAYGTTARVFAERKFHDSHRLIERIPKTTERPESTTIEMRVAGGRGLERFILSSAPDIEVLSPESVRQDVSAAYRKGLVRHEEKT